MNNGMPRGKPFSEDAILNLIDRHFERNHPSLSLGRGDDCAIFKASHSICASTDMFLENVHFRRSYFYPYEVGHKALAVNISDLAACGAKPLAFTLCLGLPAWMKMVWLDSFFRGMAHLAKKYRLVLVGGDLSFSEQLHISITIFGEELDGSGFLTRNSARPGDILFLVGQIGLARVGLEELERSSREAIPQWPTACRTHLTPEPQVEAGLMLARAGYNSRPPALMDVSDGLARDLPRLLQQDGSKNLGAQIYISEKMLHPEVCNHANINGRDPVYEAFLGGEDYALLGACAPDLFQSLQSAIPELWSIGEVKDNDKIIFNGHSLENNLGFDHFCGNDICQK